MIANGFSNGKYINEKSCRVFELFVVLFNCIQTADAG